MTDYLDEIAVRIEKRRDHINDRRRLVAALRAVEAVFADWEGFDVVDEARAAIRAALEAR